MKITVEFDSLDELLSLQPLLDAVRTATVIEPAMEEEAKADPSNAMNIPIDKMRITSRSLNCLRNLGLKTVGDVSKCSGKHLLKSQNFGRKSLNEIKFVLFDDYKLTMYP